LLHTGLAFKASSTLEPANEGFPGSVDIQQKDEKMQIALDFRITHLDHQLSWTNYRASGFSSFP
jgi:hypothetical protein